MHFASVLAGVVIIMTKKKKKMLIRYYHQSTIYDLKTSLYWLKHVSIANLIFSEKRKIYELKGNKSYHGLEMS